MNTYKHLVRDSFAELKNSETTVTNVLTKILRLSQLTGGFLGDNEGKKVYQISKAKLNALEDIIDDVTSSGKKLVIMARFIPEIEAIKKLLVKKDLSFSVITGDVKDRADEIAKFQNDADVLVFLGQTATAGLGITLTASSTMVFYSLDYSMSNFEQAKARIHRTGQRKNCAYIYLIASNTVDEKILEALRNKVNLAKSLIDNYKNGLNPYANEGGFNMDDSVMFELAERLKTLKNEKKQKELELRNISDMLTEIEAALAEFMTLNKTPNFTHGDTSFSLRTSLKASAVVGKKEELYDLLKSSGYGDLVVETVSPSSLSAFVKEQISENENELPEWLDGLVNIFEKNTVSTRKYTK